MDFRENWRAKAEPIAPEPMIAYFMKRLLMFSCIRVSVGAETARDGMAL
jgi:hypothetical protein